MSFSRDVQFSGLRRALGTMYRRLGFWLRRLKALKFTGALQRACVSYSLNSLKGVISGMISETTIRFRVYKYGSFPKLGVQSGPCTRISETQTQPTWGIFSMQTTTK